MLAIACGFMFVIVLQLEEKNTLADIRRSTDETSRVSMAVERIDLATNRIELDQDFYAAVNAANAIAVNLPPPTQFERAAALGCLANFMAHISFVLQTPAPTPADCDELRRLEVSIQAILKYCPIAES